MKILRILGAAIVLSFSIVPAGGDQGNGVVNNDAYLNMSIKLNAISYGRDSNGAIKKRKIDVGSQRSGSTGVDG